MLEHLQPPSFFWGLGVKNRVSVRLPSCFGGLGLRVESLAFRAKGFCQK